MANVEAFPPDVIRKYRTRLASVWLARSYVTALDAVKAMIGETSITIHSAYDAELLLQLDWGGDAVFIETVVPNRRYMFTDLEASFTFVDAILLSCSHSLSQPNSLASAALMDETFWQLGSTKKAKSVGTETKQKAKSGWTANGPIPQAIPMHTASMVPWVSAWAR